MHKPREYNSPAREQAMAETREKILEAVVRVILDDGIHAFTIQAVADRAGVSHRTVYRHFATREALLTGLNEAVYATSEPAGVAAPTDIAGLRALVRPLFAHFHTIRDAMRATVIAGVALGFQTPQQRQQLDLGRELLRAAYPGLGEQRLTEAAAMLRLLISRHSWHALSVEMQLPPEPIGNTVSWAVNTLLDALERENAGATPAP
jgi:AcrR family transcriptional regulator